jgi:glycosyltransferase involved in cell wall biosynthesis
MDASVLVSVVTPSYNSEEYLSGAIDSVLLQSYSNWEMIVVDDCSSDCSGELVREYAMKDSRIKLITLDINSGAAVARNAAIKAAQGRYIAFLDSDDRWLPCKLEKQLSFMQKHGVAFSYTAYEKLDCTGSVVGNVNIPPKVSYKDLLKVCSIGCLTAMYDTEKIGKIYMPLIRKRQDLGLWLRILKSTPYAYGLNEVLAQYHLRKDSISADKRTASTYTWRLYRDVEGLSFLVAAYYFTHYAFNGVLRTKLPKFARLLGKL